MTAYMPLPPSRCHENQLAAAPVHTSAIDGRAELPVLAVFSATALQQPRQASPERVGEYGKLNHSSVRCGNRSIPGVGKALPIGRQGFGDFLYPHQRASFCACNGMSEQLQW